MLVYSAESDFSTMGINDIKPNAVIWVDKLINRLVAFILAGSKYSVLNQSADILVAFVVCKSRKLANIADAVVAEGDSVANKHIAFAPTEKMLKLI